MISSPVGTLAGQQDVSQQLFDRSMSGANGSSGSEFDAILAYDLGADLATKLESQLVAGSGTARNLRGLANAVGRTSVAKTNASPTAASNVKALGDITRQAAEAYGTTENLIILMSPRRLAWIVSTLAISRSGLRRSLPRQH